MHRDEVLVRLSPRGVTRLTGAAARAVAGSGTPEPDGWTRARVPVESPDDAHARFLALGADAEVLEPPELRARLARTARMLAQRYGAGYTDADTDGDGGDRRVPLRLDPPSAGGRGGERVRRAPRCS
ncbi:WYL domain-containing protein [Streptomyces sp. NPDC051310]|uniref:WYL domain-containing protein n=1 Tax=Streptomyces sp. NPDC051310 TaxID=3365649 RepID=UPI0037AF572E